MSKTEQRGGLGTARPTTNWVGRGVPPRRWITKTACIVGLFFLAAWLWLPFPQAKLERYPASTAVLDRDGQPLRVALGSNDVFCLPVSLAKTGPWLSQAIIAAEDKRFYQHSGVDVLALGRAFRQNLTSRRVVSGASTISTQIIRLIEPRSRNVWTKLVEAFQAMRMERRYTKPQILEQYLNRAPFGSNLIGVEAASRRYFDKSAADLSLAEAALLAGLPQAPTRLRPDLFPQRAAKRRDYVLARMQECGFISRAQFETARAEPIACRIEKPVFRAPHFCDLVLARHPQSGTGVSPVGVDSLEQQRHGRDTRATIHTTLDSSLQLIAEESLRRQVTTPGVHGGSIVIIEVKTGAVRALVGSPDFWNQRWRGQVNGATARRSPGSALKPFVYATAIDQGLCTPATMIADVPLAIAGFHPQNFDHEFSGPVTVREALVRSLNIPALRMAQQVGQFNLVTLLRQTGLRTLDKSASHYGLGVALGSGEVTLLDLANAYACFARGGEYRPYRLAMMPDGGGLGTARPTPNLVGRGVPTAPLAGKSCRLFSAEAAYLITDMLSGEERAADLCGHVTDAQLPRIAWKTGTSAGQRDAWTIAFNPEYVVGVWLGNPDGRGAPCLVGRTVAVPLAFAVFRRLYPTGAAPWFTPPVGLRYRSVCAASGCVPTAHCRTTITDTYLPGISATVECPLHRGATTIAQTAEVETFLRSHGMAGKPVSKISDLKINSPAAGERICGEKQELAFSVITDSAVEPVHWFVDGEWYATRLPDERLFWRLAKGRHVIACSDSHNHGDSVQIEVE